MGIDAVSRGLAVAPGRPNHSTVITAHQRLQERVKTESPIAAGGVFDGMSAGELTNRVERVLNL